MIRICKYLVLTFESALLLSLQDQEAFYAGTFFH